MNTYLSIFLAIVLVGCATTPHDASIQDEANVRAIATQIFGWDSNLIVRGIHPERFATSHYSDGSSAAYSAINEMDLRDDMLLGTFKECNLVVWGRSSPITASAVIRALSHPLGPNNFPHLRLLFVGDAKDAEVIRPKIEATGAQFHFHQQVNIARHMK